MLTFIGLVYPLISKSVKTRLMLLSCLIFCGTSAFSILSTGSYLSTQTCKYPPRLYYLSYGIFISFLLLSVTEVLPISLYKSRIIVFISKHSLWIYLWHIFIVFIVEQSGICQWWFLKWILFVFGSSIIVLIQNLLISLAEKRIHLHFFKYFTN